MPQTPFSRPKVERIFEDYTPEIKARLLSLRELIFQTAAEMEQVGEVAETLKWGQPSYLTLASRTGTTIRIDQVKDDPQHYALYVHCQTNLIQTFREIYPDFTYDGDRAIIFDIEDEPPLDALQDCIGMALTYHWRKQHKVRTE